MVSIGNCNINVKISSLSYNFVDHPLRSHTMVPEDRRSNAVCKLMVKTRLPGHGNEFLLLLVSKVSFATRGVSLCVDSNHSNVRSADGDGVVSLL